MYNHQPAGPNKYYWFSASVEVSVTYSSTVQLKLLVKTKFPFISPTCFTQIPQMGILLKQFSLISSLFSRRGKNRFPRQGILFPH